MVAMSFKIAQVHREHIRAPQSSSVCSIMSQHCMVSLSPSQTRGTDALDQSVWPQND